MMGGILVVILITYLIPCITQSLLKVLFLEVTKNQYSLCTIAAGINNDTAKTG
jgi:hypothetical protein